MKGECGEVDVSLLPGGVQEIGIALIGSRLAREGWSAAEK